MVWKQLYPFEICFLNRILNQENNFHQRYGQFHSFLNMVHLVKMCLIFYGSPSNSLIRNQKILLGYSFGCKNLLNFTCHTIKFHNCHHPIAHWYLNIKSFFNWFQFGGGGDVSFFDKEMHIISLENWNQLLLTAYSIAVLLGMLCLLITLIHILNMQPTYFNR